MHHYSHSPTHIGFVHAVIRGENGRYVLPQWLPKVSLKALLELLGTNLSAIVLSHVISIEWEQAFRVYL